MTLRASDPQLAELARAKLSAGESPTREEAAALARVDKDQLERTTIAVLESCDRQAFFRATTLNRQNLFRMRKEGAYGVADDQPVNIGKLIKWMHEEMYSRRPDECLEKAERRFRVARAEEKELAVQKARGELLHCEDVREMLQQYAMALRTTVENVRRTYPDSAREIDEALKEAEDKCVRAFSELSATANPDETFLRDSSAAPPENDPGVC